MTRDPDAASQQVTSGSRAMVIQCLSAALLYDEVEPMHSVKDACNDVFYLPYVHGMGHMFFSRGIRNFCHK